MEALRRRDVTASVQISRIHVDVLHRTMFMALTNPDGPVIEPDNDTDPDSLPARK